MAVTQGAGIMAFENADFGRIRAVSENGEPWFVAKDVATVLGYSSVGAMNRTLFDDEKGVRILHTPGGDQSISTVNEPGFYHAVMQRRSSWVKDDAARQKVESFQRWVTHEVLPAIRRDGGYMAAKPDETPEETMARALRIADETMRRQKERIESLSSANAEMRPKALFADAVAASESTCLVGELAKMLRQNGVDIGQNRLFAWLRDNGWLGKSGCNRNVPTQKAMDMGLFRIKETAVTHSDGHVTVTRTPKVTGKGQAYFVNRFIEAEGEGRLFPCA